MKINDVFSNGYGNSQYLYKIYLRKPPVTIDKG